MKSIVRIKIKKASNLTKKDIFGASDPYVAVYLANKDEVRQDLQDQQDQLCVISRQTAHARYYPRQPGPVTASSMLTDYVMQ